MRITGYGSIQKLPKIASHYSELRRITELECLSEGWQKRGTRQKLTPTMTHGPHPQVPSLCLSTDGSLNILRVKPAGPHLTTTPGLMAAHSSYSNVVGDPGTDGGCSASGEGDGDSERTTSSSWSMLNPVGGSCNSWSVSVKANGYSAGVYTSAAS
jgi:hypothetical protein